MKRVILLLVMLGSLAVVPIGGVTAGECTDGTDGASGGTGGDYSCEESLVHNDRFLVGGGNPELILGTSHADVRPIQDCVDHPQVEWLVQELKRAGKFEKDILVWVFTDSIWIMQGHHRYVASKYTGIEIWALVDRKFDQPAGTSFGMQDWSNVGWCQEPYTDDSGVSGG